MKTALVKSLLIGMLALAGMLAGDAFAAQAQDQFQVQAQVNANCLVTANNLTFSTPYDGVTDNDSTTTVDVKCTKNTAYTVQANAGATTGSTLLARLMNFSTDYMQYNLYTDLGHTTIWGDTTDGTVVFSGTGAGMGTTQSYTVYGRIPAGQNLMPGTYTETAITVTVIY